MYNKDEMSPKEEKVFIGVAISIFGPITIIIILGCCLIIKSLFMELFS